MPRPTDDLSKVLFTRISKAQLSLAKREAKRLGISLAALARLALEKLLNQQGA